MLIVQAGDAERAHAEVPDRRVAVWHGNSEGSGGGGGSSTRFTVFQDEHLVRFHAELPGSFPVDFRVRLAVGDIFGGQRDGKPMQQVDSLQECRHIAAR